MFDISIIIINYKVKEYIIPCIESIYKHTSKSLRYEILVIDNNSNDGSIDAIKSQFSEVKIYQNTENIGFSKAVNQGAETAIGKYIFILNPDTKLIEDSISILFTFLEKNETVAVVGPAIVTESGIKQQSYWKEPTLINTILSIYHLDFLNYKKNYRNEIGDKTILVDSISGGAFFVQKDVFQNLNGYHPNLFWMEDIDFCTKVRKLDNKIIYYPETKIIHYGGKSAEKDLHIAISNQLLSKIKYFKLHHSGIETIILTVAILFIALIKSILFLIVFPLGSNYRKKMIGYLSVIKGILTNTH
tara:strand:- start:968 stop:1873 length:906 start_codon:yes stop_codon:yes gene_type:complete